MAICWVVSGRSRAWANSFSLGASPPPGQRAVPVGRRLHELGHHLVVVLLEARDHLEHQGDRARARRVKRIQDAVGGDAALRPRSWPHRR